MFFYQLVLFPARLNPRLDDNRPSVIVVDHAVCADLVGAIVGDLVGGHIQNVVVADASVCAGRPDA